MSRDRAVGVLSRLAGMTVAEIAVDDNDVEVPLGDLPAVRVELWRMFSAEATRDPVRAAELASVDEEVDTPKGPVTLSIRRMSFDGATMRYTMGVIGAGPKPANGYPVYLCLHGGGDDAAENDTQWAGMAIHTDGTPGYYSPSIETGIHVAVRGVTDTRNMHSRPQSYPLYDRLIENLVALEGADPDRVYLIGFSAGGSGVHQAAARMADRFAGAAMSSGLPHDASLHNLYALPFFVQVGEYDFAEDRNLVAVDTDVRLDALAAEAGGGYPHRTLIHRGGSHNRPWRDDDPDETSASPVYADPQAWRPVWIARSHHNWRASATARDEPIPRPPDPFTPPEHGSAIPVAPPDDPSGLHVELVDSNAVRLVSARARDPRLPRVRWDLASTAPTRSGIAEDGERLFPTPHRPRLSSWVDAIDADPTRGTEIDVELVPASNEIRIRRHTDTLRILLDGDLLDLAQPITITSEAGATSFVARTSLRRMASTLLDRGDPRYVFPAAVTITFAPDGTPVAT